MEKRNPINNQNNQINKKKKIQLECDLHCPMEAGRDDYRRYEAFQNLRHRQESCL